MKKIVFAGGCFWGVEAYFNTIEGVLNTKVGYANGDTENPTYDEVCTDKTGYAEACFLEYDSNKVKLESLLEAYFKVVDPTLENRQGHDEGTQYRTGIYYFDKDDEKVIKEYKAKEQEKYEAPIVTEILPLKNFYDAEEYHQKYLDKNPNGYCHIPKELLKKH
ncbi:peptide-methionine (S)-S-oxide reductase MsrA [Clostridium felsineum]|uniref:Peptide methionine sulfoxide reductase MsrA n=1 Tax=Clostridium felsineum TaxID=36839 RepID=A0A1S8L3K1_9CLOT|nr:peptide-methionine (S)-S-oxide reductase MsrA [Clostridium felsineum]MCR3758939.1 peptide-methionine (S)-S-oxide reductase MsrA [Clostridium felsineum]URZ02700.1 Peptide methionine sulfoxide reductase MsrA [Clostridium felsineum]URZ08977.1 Peptide methionine sulfoxide reductase MsrA [Clostridium felsineum]URZ09605.1 Peptide methionine sulfoxide reductase MsrA [Clostridium felsineum]